MAEYNSKGKKLFGDFVGGIKLNQNITFCTLKYRLKIKESNLQMVMVRS